MYVWGGWEGEWEEGKAWVGGRGDDGWVGVRYGITRREAAPTAPTEKKNDTSM